MKINAEDTKTILLLNDLVERIMAGKVTTHDRRAEFEGNLATLTVVMEDVLPEPAPSLILVT